MGFTVTPLTAVPLNGDNTQDSTTWGETNAPYATPGNEDVGWMAGGTVPAATLNYSTWHYGRWIRAMRDRMVFADEGLLTTCVVSQGTWNTGGGTLDVTLTPTRLVADVNGDGGVLLEVTAPVGSPETLTASRDTYVDFDEAGGYTLVAVPNGNPEPALTPGHVRVYKLVTDALELTSATLVTGIAAFPCFGPSIGIVALYAGSINAQTLDVVGASTFDDVMVGGGLTVAGDVFAQSDLYVTNELHVAAAADFNDTLTVTGTLTANGDVTLGNAGTDALIVPATATFQSPVFMQGNIELGNAAADIVTIYGTTTINEDVTMIAGKTLTARQIDTVTSSGYIAAGEVQFYSDATPSTVNGVMQWAGRFLTIGQSATATKVAIMFESYVAGPVNTVNPIQDTGASVTRTLAAGDVVIVEMSYEATNTSAANNVNVQIEANAVTIGGTQAYRPVANSVYFTVRRVVEFTAGASIAYTFVARFGASAGTSSVTNVHLSVRHRT